ncbi:uncharacterized protein EV422DRAFT_348968 [Fimicolochytrium jonesii]|uniref:uncharacterized protein n=1 Tax=Fimicolochytrium jonesii TaxID=1396493 RepID=UPI0022FE58A5|nr:uncharacterized protein EV422DRAFT_348968 [Fimicolochytrium jonesii]KAI8815602.1 hypothetical protein EV422DRAFT_348968 [Fimicolochytrium jonesii]
MDSVPALIIVCFTASWVSSFLGESLYHREMHQNKTPYLPSDPSHSMRTITVRKIMSSRNLVVITTHPRLSACLSALQSGFIGFPVCEKLAVEDSTGQTLIKYRPVGFVYRDLLAETLKRLVDDQGFDPDQTRIDMTPLSNVSPVVVREDSTASKVFGMVRQLGLRHVMVVNHDGFLVGILTRKDLLRGMHYYDHIHHKKGHGKKKKHQQQHHAHARGTLKRDKMTMKIWAERPKSEKEREGTASSLVIPATDVPGTPRHTHFGSTGGLVVPPLPVPARGDTVLDLDTLYHQHLQQHGSEDSAGDLTASTANLLNQPGEHHTHSPPASPKLGTTPTPVRRAHFQDTAAPPTIATAFPFPETSIPIGPRTPTAPHSTSTPASPSVTPGRAAWNRTRLRLRANAGFTLKKLHDDSGDDVAHSSSSSSASSSSSSDSSSSDSSESESEGRGVRVRFGERARQTRRERRERRGKNRAMMIRRRTGL